MNYSTYFSRGQKVFLINTSQERDESLFEAFSATIVNCDNRRFELRPRYTLHHGDSGHLSVGMRFKITAESYGSGVQFIGVIKAVYSHGFTMEPSGQMEMYQRAQAPRMDLLLGFRSFTKSAPLAFFRSEWQRFTESIESGRTTRLELPSTPVNIGVGGLRHVVGRSDHQTDLAMMFIDIGDSKPPVCAVAEQMWRRTLPEDDAVAIGRRFVLIRKCDQERIKTCIDLHRKKEKKDPFPERNNWELLDRMIYNR